MYTCTGQEAHKDISNDHTLSHSSQAWTRSPLVALLTRPVFVNLSSLVGVVLVRVIASTEERDELRYDDESSGFRRPSVRESLSAVLRRLALVVVESLEASG